MAIAILPVNAADAWQQARELVADYARSLSVNLSFQQFSQELADLDTVYGPPAGVFLLASDAGHSLGCVGVRPLTGTDCEMKRLYVAPEARGRGHGRLLATSAIEAAVRLGYHRILLDTLPTMGEAQALYQCLGFVAVPAYRFNPVAGTVFMARDLRPRSPTPPGS